MDILRQSCKGASVLFWVNLDRCLTALMTASALFAGGALALSALSLS
jgi:hypothetical protein